MKKRLFCAFLIIFAVAVNVLIISKGQNLTDSGVNVNLELEMDADTDVQVMYSDGIFDLEHVSTVPYKKEIGKQSLVFDIPADYTAWRLDYGEYTGEIRLYSMSVATSANEHKIDRNAVLNAEQHDIGNIEERDGACVLVSDGIDPYSILDMREVGLDSILNGDSQTKSLVVKIIICTFFDIFLIFILLRMDSLYTSLTEMFHCRKLILSLAKNDFKTKYVGSLLGMLWAFIRPVITVLVYWFVFQVGLGSQDVNGCPFVLWLITGLVPWFFFSEALSGGTASLLEYQYLVKKIVFKISTIPVVKVFSALFVHVFFMALPVVIYCCYGNAPHLYMLQLFYYLICMVVFMLAVVYFTSAVVLFFKDTIQIIGVILEIGIWMTPIMWQLTLIPEPFRWIFKINPMYYIVYGYRDSIISKVWFWDKMYLTCYFWILTILMFAGGLKIFNRLKVHFADVL